MSVFSGVFLDFSSLSLCQDSCAVIRTFFYHTVLPGEAVTHRSTVAGTQKGPCRHYPVTPAPQRCPLTPPHPAAGFPGVTLNVAGSLGGSVG